MTSLAAAQLQFFRIGAEQSPLLVIDDFSDKIDNLLTEAGTIATFRADPANFYPGVRKPCAGWYQQQLLGGITPLLPQFFAEYHQPQPQLLLCAYALSTFTPAQLRPIQMVPHFDTAQPRQLALVHYLCDESFGGTSFYQHRHSGFERISSDRLVQYGSRLKVEAQQAQLHLDPRYMNGDTSLFQRIHQVAAKKNRLIIYPSNLLHSGDLAQTTALPANPQQGRLTISSFIRV